jgi:gliding motility-associated-like protein
VLWSGGAGSFSNANSLNATYTPTAAEKTSTSPVVLTLTGTAPSPCPAVKSTVSIGFVPVPVVDAQDVPKLCVNVDSVVLSATSKNAASVLWSGGLGSFKNSGSLNAVYYPTTAEKSASAGITLTLTGQGNTPCPSTQDQTKLTFVPLASVTIPAVPTFCNAVDSVLVKASSQNTTALTWSGGSGRFSKINVAETYYYPSLSEKNSASAITLTLRGTAQSPCPQVSQTVAINLVKTPSVAAVDLPIFCSSVDSVPLNGTSQNAASTAWSGGSGIFKNSASANTTYYPTTTEKNSSQGLILTLVAQGNTPCPSVQDTIKLLFAPTATVTIPAVPAICNTTDSVRISASSQNTTVLMWSGGSGRFGKNNVLQTYYYPSQAEKNSADTITITLIGTAQSPCPQVRARALITLVKAPSVAAVDLPIYCTTVDSLQLSGLAQNSSASTWSGGTGVFKDAAAANTVYYPSAADKSTSPITLRFDAIAKAPCSSIFDTVSLRIVQKPYIQLQPAPSICATADSLPVVWLSQNVKSLQWIVAGTMNTTGVSQANYMPTAGEKMSPSIRLVVDATGYSPCPNMRDTLEVAVVQPPQVQTSALQAICSSTDSVTLRGAKAQTQKVMWLGGNGGVFDHKDSIATAYHLSATDKTKDSLMFYFMGSANAPCLDTKDSVLLRLVALPAIDALELGPFCEDVDSIGLKVSTDHLKAVSWLSLTGGSFNDPQSASTTYFPSVSEKKSGQTIINVVGEALAPCSNINDSVRIQYIPQATVIANATGPFCADVDKIELSGTALNTAGVRWYVGSGSLNNRDVLNASYSPSVAERKGTNIMARLVGLGLAPCKNAEDTIWVKLHPLPNVTHTELSFCSDDNTTALLDAGIATHYSWIGLGDTTRYVRVPNAGTFNVQVKNQFGCAANRTVETSIECPPRLFVSNAFSPNADGTNDKYTVYHIHIGAYQMLIFNRWGEIIYESKNPDEAWDGTYRGESMPIGVYEWIITYEGDSPKYRGPYSLKGSVTVVR